MTFFIALLPRFILNAYRVLYRPNDIDILRIVHKETPDIDLEHDPLAGGRWSSDGVLKPYDTIGSTTAHSHPRRQSRREEDLYPLQDRRPTMGVNRNTGTRTDMSTGLPMTDRGFDFSTEEGGVAIRRIQTNLSEQFDPATGRKRNGGGNVRRRASRFIPSSLRRSLHHPHSRRNTVTSQPSEADSP